MKLLDRSYAWKIFIAVTFTHLPHPCSVEGSHTCSSVGYILKKLGLKVWGSIFLANRPDNSPKGVGEVGVFCLFVCFLKFLCSF